MSYQKPFVISVSVFGFGMKPTDRNPETKIGMYRQEKILTQEYIEILEDTETPEHTGIYQNTL